MVDNVDLLPKGRTLDVAMGRGRNAVYLARMGFEVEGIDLSTDAVSDALEWARQSEVNIKTHLTDLENNYHIEKGL
ncbi:MAG: methyltransferase domain-containing protein, partial [Thermodesulfobacteriota bacterium]|nr:methyltransferase domain-containing protein [Thermodesulfobacteriota bacterium]